MSELPAPQSGSALAPNVAGALAYLLGPITGVAFLILERENRFVRFHAAQSVAVGLGLILVSIAFSVVTAILAVVPILGWILGFFLALGFAFATFALWIVLMYRAYRGQEWEVPVASAYARRLTAPAPATH